MTHLSHGFSLDPLAKGPPRAAVVLLHDPATSVVILQSLAARWAMSVPTTAFIGLESITEMRTLSCNASNSGFDGGTESALLDHVVRALEPMLERRLRTLRLDLGRLVVVGFGCAGTLALYWVLHQGWPCTGVLTFAANLTRPLPRLVRFAPKVRLIRYAADVGHSGLSEDLALLAARGIDARAFCSPVQACRKRRFGMGAPISSSWSPRPSGVSIEIARSGRCLTRKAA